MSDHAHQKQGRRKKAMHTLFLTILIVSGMTLTACGKKPGRVDPPISMDGKDDTFPLVYPDPETDPKPEPGNQ